MKSGSTFDFLLRWWLWLW